MSQYYYSRPPLINTHTHTHTPQAKDTFQDLPFSVLGLGDTNYDKYCHMGKSIDKRLEELGASLLYVCIIIIVTIILHIHTNNAYTYDTPILGGKRILDLHCADEGTGELSPLPP
jgi:hypothetical protein